MLLPWVPLSTWPIPASVTIHDKAVDWIAELWNCPRPPQSTENFTLAPLVHFSGSATVGSTEAWLLAGLAHNFRWRKWYANLHGLTATEVIGVRPNLVVSSCFQAAWEKLFKYFDVEPRFVKPSIHTFQVDPKEIRSHLGHG